MKSLEQIKLTFIASPLARAQYAKNAKQLQGLANLAKQSGKNVRGKSESYWQAKANEFAKYTKFPA